MALFVGEAHGGSKHGRAKHAGPDSTSVSSMPAAGGLPVGPDSPLIEKADYSELTLGKVSGETG